MKSGKYLSNFLKMHCSIDIQTILYNHLDTKEITECMSIYNFIRNWLYYNKDVEYIIDCGSGKYSVLGLIMAFNYKVKVISVDPREDLRIDIADKVDRFEIVQGYLKNLDIPKDKKILLLCNHSHAKESHIKDFLNDCVDWAYLTVPCCYDNTLKNRSGICYSDKHSWSEKNKIYFYTSKSIDFKNICGTINT